MQKHKDNPMRVTKVCRQLTGVEDLYASDVELTPGGLVFSVRPRWRRPRCGGCGRRAPCYDRRPERDWRHLAVGSTVLWLRYAPWRVACPGCGVTVEAVPWAGHDRRFTRALEELVGLLDAARGFRLVCVAASGPAGARYDARVVETGAACRARRSWPSD